jgi:hypothetical protein
VANQARIIQPGVIQIATINPGGFGAFEIIFSAIPEQGTEIGVKIGDETQIPPERIFASSGPESMMQTFVPIAGQIIINLRSGTTIQLVVTNTFLQLQPAVFRAVGGTANNTTSIVVKQIGFATQGIATADMIM